MRYNDQAYVDAYVKFGRYPRIHDPIVEVVRTEVDAGSGCDLFSSTGLLGRRMVSCLGWRMCAVDRDLDAIGRGVAAGVYGDDLPIQALTLHEQTIDVLAAWLREHEVDTIIARRCLPEASDSVNLTRLAESWADTGVAKIVLEGRQIDRRAIHPFGSALQQASALSGHYRVTTQRGEVMVMTRRGGFYS